MKYKNNYQVDKPKETKKQKPNSVHKKKAPKNKLRPQKNASKPIQYGSSQLDSFRGL